MKYALSSFGDAFKMIKSDKLNFLLALVPVLIGIVLYYLLGSWIYGSLMSKGQELVASYVSAGSAQSFIGYILAALVSVILFLIVNWTFVLVISIIASPFNDMLSSRIEKKMKNKNQEKTQTHFIIYFFSVIFNELKKISFIFVMSMIALILGYIPLLAPLSFFITVLLLASSFLDYSWARHDIKFSACVKDVRGNMFSYAIGGIFFFVLVTVPLINLIVPPLATSYFTILWLKNNEHSH